MRRLIVALCVIMLGMLAATTSAQAQQPRTGGGGAGVNAAACGEGCGGGEDISPPEIFLASPGGLVYTEYPTITLRYCDDTSLDASSRVITVNGINRLSSFNFVNETGCARQASSTTSSVPLVVGSNSIYAYICDYASNCEGHTFTVVRAEGPPPVVSLAPYSAHLQDYARCVMSCFAATHAQSTVPYYTLNSPRNVTVAYNGDRVDPKPFVHVDVTHGGDASNLPLYFTFKVLYNGTPLQFVNGQSELFFAPQAGTALRMGGQFNASQLGGTGVYPVTVVVRAQYATSSYDTPVATRVIVVNNNASSIARGWSVAGLQRVHLQADGSLLIVEGDGSATYFLKSGSTFITPSGDFTTIRTGGDAGLGTWQRWYPDSTVVSFNSVGQMYRVTDRFGSMTRFNYDGSGRLITILDPVYSYPSNQKQITLAYGANGLSTVSDHTGRVTTFTVGAGGFLTQIRDPDNLTTTYGYDGSSRLSTVTNRAGHTTTLAYHTSGKLLTVTAPAVAVFGEGTIAPVTTLSPWHVVGVPYATTSAQSPAPVVRADTSRGRVTDSDGHAVAFTVDAFGQALRTGAPLGDTVTVTYNGVGLPTQVVDRLGLTSNHLYNAAGFLTRSIAANDTTNFRSGGWGQADSTWASGASRGQRFFLNATNGRVDSVRVGGVSGQLPANQYKIRYTYDVRGRVLTARDNQGHLLEQHWYNGPDGALSKDSTPTGATISYAYDSFGRRTSVTVSGQPARTTQYDVLNRPTVQSDGVNPSPTTYFHGALTLDSLRDPRGQVYRFQYNALGWQVAEMDPNGAAQTYAYSRDGLVRRHTNRRGQTIDVTYDALHRPLTRGGMGVWDASFSYSGDARVLTASNFNSTITTYLNALHRQPDSTVTVLRTPDGQGAQTYSQRFTYTPQHWLATTSFSGPAAIMSRTYAWVAATGALDSMRLGANRWTDFTYNADLQAPQRRFSPWASETRTFAEGHGTTSIVGPGLHERYGYDRLARLTGAQHVPSGRHWNYLYDGLGRLDSTIFYGNAQTCEDDPQYGTYCYGFASDSTHNFDFDAVGNRTDHGGTYAWANRVTNFDNCAYGTPDADGNVTSRACAGAPTFTWTGDGLLSGYTTGGNSYTFAYDPFGRLMRRDVNGAANRYFLWDGDQLVAELGPTATTKIAEYSYYPGGLDNLHAIGIGNTQYNAHTDALGNVRALTDSAGTIRRSYNYDEWGQVYANSADQLPFNGADRARFKGALWMGPELDLYYMRNRWYEPRTGRFLSEDPIGLAGGVNPFAYASGDPINGRDPTGLIGECRLVPWRVHWDTATRNGEPVEGSLHYHIEYRLECSSGRDQGTGGEAGSGRGGRGFGTGSSTLNEADEVSRTTAQQLGDFAAGFGDFITFGGTRKVRDLIGCADCVDYSSGTYTAGQVAGGTVAIAWGGLVVARAVGWTSRVAVHEAHHSFGSLGRLAHIQVNIWRIGVSGSGRALRIPLPWR